MARRVQVAALPWRHGKAGVELLLVTTRTSKRWVIPKGWPMAGKSDHQAAAIEAFEEAGVRGVVLERAIGNYGYVKQSERAEPRNLIVHVYPLRVTQELADWPERAERQRRWVGREEAAEMTGEPALAPLLRNFVVPEVRFTLWQRLRHWLGIGRRSQWCE